MEKFIYNSSHRIRIIWRFLSFFILTFAINIPLQLLAGNLFDGSLIMGYVSGASFVVSILISLFVQIKFLEKSSFRKYGLKLDSRWFSEFGIGLLIPVIQLSLFFGLMYCSGALEITDFLTVNSAQHSFASGLFSELFNQIIASVSEEIIHRAFLFYIAFEAFKRAGQSLAKSAIFACTASSVLFGFGHISNDGASILSTANLMVSGIVLCLPFLITGRLGMSIGSHFSWNFVQGVVLGLENSGYPPKVSIIQSSLADNLFTGGAFGPEGSLLLVGLEFLAVLMIIYWKKIKGYTSWLNERIVEA